MTTMRSLLDVARPGVLAALFLLVGCAEPSAQRPSATPDADGGGAGRSGQRVQIGGEWATVWASSELDSPDGRYAAEKAFDGDPATAWVEGVDGVGDWATSGVAEILVVEFDREVEAEGFLIWPGYPKSEDLYEKNAVPIEVEVRVDDAPPEAYRLPLSTSIVFEGVGPHGPDPRPEGCYHVADIGYRAPRAVLFRRPRRLRRLTLRLTESLTGTRYDDTAVAEWRPVLSTEETSRGPAVGALLALRELRSEPGRLDALEAASVEDLTHIGVTPGGLIDFGRPLAADTVYLDQSEFGPTVAEARVNLSERSPRASRSETYASATKDAFVGVPLLLLADATTTSVLGSVTMTVGDGEWAEVRPLLAVGRGGQFVRAREVALLGGAPGCHGSLETLGRAIADAP